MYDCTWKELWLNHRAAPPAIVALSGLALSRSLPPPLRLRFETFAVAIIAAWATYCMQGKDWSYHLIPPRGLAFLFTSIQIVTVADRAGHEWSAGIVPRGVRNPLLWAAAGIGVVLASFMFTTIARTHGELEWQRVRPTVEGINTNSMSDEFITFISTDVGVAYPALIYSGRPAGTRYLCAFPIAMFYMNTRAIRGRPFPYHPPEESSAQEKLFLSELGDDVSTRRPRLVIVPNSHSQACPIGFVIDEYLHETGWFRRFMGDYDLLARSNEMSVYARRRPDQHVEASSDEFLALPRFAQQPPGHHEPGTAPVGLLDGALPSGSPPGRKILME